MSPCPLRFPVVVLPNGETSRRPGVRSLVPYLLLPTYLLIHPRLLNLAPSNFFFLPLPFVADYSIISHPSHPPMLLTGDGPWGACQPGRALFLGEGKRNTASSVRLPARAPWKKLPLWPRHIHPCPPERSGCHSLSHSLTHTHTHTHSLIKRRFSFLLVGWLAGVGLLAACQIPGLVPPAGPRCHALSRGYQ